jgi:hypothetical protein
MNQREALEKVAEQYRGEGYDVVEPSAADLPSFLVGRGVDLIARRGDERVAIHVKSRGQLYDLWASEQAAGQAGADGWRFDLVVYPPATEDVALNGAGGGVEYADTLIEEAERLLGLPSLRAAFLIAWSAAEAAMREVARREAIPLDAETPQFLVKTLYTNGILSREEYDRLQQGLGLRTSIAHGVPPDRLDPADTRFLVDFARHLLGNGTPESGQRSVPA